MVLPVKSSGDLTLFLCGDVMTGRGVDQILPRSCPPHLYEPVVDSAVTYVELAERANGPIPGAVDYAYVWGEALPILERVRPDARIINLETSITTSEDAAPKGINYRMHPANVALLTAAGIDCCVLANNHVMDWGAAGLLETLEVLSATGISVAGAGHSLTSASRPAVLGSGYQRRTLIFGAGVTNSGIPQSWAAGGGKPGVHLLPDLSDATAAELARRVKAVKRTGDVAVLSIHWGSNWGYEVPKEHRHFAHALLDEGGIDAIHGHSSHHPLAVEIYRDRPILYGCGDFIDDYEGISGYEEFRGDLTLMYFPAFDDSGTLTEFRIHPLRIRNFRLERPSSADYAWICETLERECGRLGQPIHAGEDALMLE